MKLIALLSIVTISFMDVSTAGGACFEKMSSWKVAELDPALMTAAPEFYYPLMSDLCIKRVTAALQSKKPEEVDEADYKDACLRVTLKGEDVTFKGYGGKSAAFKMTKNGTDTWTWKGTEEQGGHFKYTLTDNKTYAVIFVCTLDDKFSWSMISTVAELPESTVEEIYKHVESAGGNRKESKQVKYDSCK